MRTVDEAYAVYMLCRKRQELAQSWREEDKDELYRLEEELKPLCSGCCQECNAPEVLLWAYPEILDRR